MHVELTDCAWLTDWENWVFLKKSSLKRCFLVDTWKPCLELSIKLYPEDVAFEIIPTPTPNPKKIAEAMEIYELIQ